MGRPKLIMTVGGVTVIARVVAALRGGGVSLVVVVTPPSGAPGSDALSREALAAGAYVLMPEVQPPDMRTSFEIGLSHLERLEAPPATVLLAPADSPGMSEGLVKSVIERARLDRESILTPSVGGRRGHPVAIPWRLALKVRELPQGLGVNALLGLHGGAVRTFEVDDPGAVADLDTPEDYREWEGRAASSGWGGG